MLHDLLRRRVKERARVGGVTLAVAAMVAGCGSAGPGKVSGAGLFSTHCGACHSLSGSSSPRQQGGDLERLRLPRSELLQFTAEMPPMHGRLTRRELQTVVSYLQSVPRRRR